MARMTRTDFEKIAASFKAALNEHPYVVDGEAIEGLSNREAWAALDSAAKGTAAVLATTNPLFDRARFLKA